MVKAPKLPFTPFEFAGGRTPESVTFNQTVSGDLDNDLLNLTFASSTKEISITVTDNILVQSFDVNFTVLETTSTPRAVGVSLLLNNKTLLVGSAIADNNILPNQVMRGSVGNVLELFIGDTIVLRASTSGMGAGEIITCTGSISLLGRYK